MTAVAPPPDCHAAAVAARREVCDKALEDGTAGLQFPPKSGAPSRLLPTTPSVTAMVSGGGWRAMESAAHFYDALAHYGLTAVTSEVQGLSGGSWGTAMVCMTGEHNRFHGPENQVRHSQEAMNDKDLVQVPTHLKYLFDENYANSARDAVHTECAWYQQPRRFVLVTGFFAAVRFGVDKDVAWDTASKMASQSQTMWETYMQILAHQLFGTPVPQKDGTIDFQKPTELPALHQFLNDKHDQPVAMIATVHEATSEYTSSIYGFDGLDTATVAQQNSAENARPGASALTGGLRRITNGDEESKATKKLAAAARVGERVPLAILHAQEDRSWHDFDGRSPAENGQVPLTAPAVLAICGSAWMITAPGRGTTTHFPVKSAIGKPEQDFGFLIDAGGTINLPIPFVTSKSRITKGRTDIVLVCDASGGETGERNFALARKHGAIETDMDPKVFDAAVNKDLPEDTVRVIFPKEGSDQPVFIISHGDVSPTGTMVIFRTPEALEDTRRKIFSRVGVLKHAVQEILALDDWPTKENLVMDVTATTKIVSRTPPVAVGPFAVAGHRIGMLHQPSVSPLLANAAMSGRQGLTTAIGIHIATHAGSSSGSLTASMMSPVGVTAASVSAEVRSDEYGGESATTRSTPRLSALEASPLQEAVPMTLPPPTTAGLMATSPAPDAQMVQEPAEAHPQLCMAMGAVPSQHFPLQNVASSGPYIPHDAADSTNSDPLTLLVAGEKRCADRIGFQSPMALRRLAIARLLGDLSDDDIRSVMGTSAKVPEEELTAETNARCRRFDRLYNDLSYQCFAVASALYDHTLSTATEQKLPAQVTLPELEEEAEYASAAQQAFATADYFADANDDIPAAVTKTIDELVKTDDAVKKAELFGLTVPHIVMAFFAAYCTLELLEDEHRPASELQGRPDHKPFVEAVDGVLSRIADHCRVPAEVTQALMQHMTTSIPATA